MDDIKLPPLPAIPALDLTQKFEDYARAAVELNREKPGPWVPKHGETYWYVTERGKCPATIARGDAVDVAMLAAHNVYRTEDDAQQGALRDVAMRKLFAAGLTITHDGNATPKVAYDDYIAIRNAWVSLTDAERAAIGGGR